MDFYKFNGQGIKVVAGLFRVESVVCGFCASQSVLCVRSIGSALCAVEEREPKMGKEKILEVRPVSLAIAVRPFCLELGLLMWTVKSSLHPDAP